MCHWLWDGAGSGSWEDLAEADTGDLEENEENVTGRRRKGDHYYAVAGSLATLSPVAK